MTKEQFDQEKNYHISLTISKELLARGVITQGEYQLLDALFLEKYQPIISSL